MIGRSGWQESGRDWHRRHRIQLIGEIADKVGDLTVFQRRPNWSAPLNNSAISEEENGDIRSRYEEIFAACARTPGVSCMDLTAAASTR